ncbi:MAG: hypothetical protein AAB975_04065 [Patescibacteria group bacterium]
MLVFLVSPENLEFRNEIVLKPSQSDTESMEAFLPLLTTKERERANRLIADSNQFLPKSLFSIFFPTPFCAILAAKPSDLLNVGTATFRRSSGFSLKISPKWLWKKDYEQALSHIP